MGERLPKPLPEAVDAGNEAYLIHNRAEIIALLRSLARERALVSAYHGPGGSFLLTSVLAVNPEFEEIILDVGPDNNAAAHPRDSPITVVGFLDGVKLQFQADHVEDTQWEGSPALRVRVPRTVLRLQRRDAYRVRTSVLRPPTCHVPAAAGRSAAALRVSDLSCGGIALAIRPGEPRHDRGMQVTGCVLELPGLESIGVDLEVRHTADTTDAAGRALLHCGCRFIRLPGPATTMIQRYINTVERERRRLLG
jgi:c-di-GMP-binding flagellar brake protein YcgR